VLIDLRRAVEPDEWGRLVREDSRATFFHTLPWMSLLAGSQPGMRPLFLMGSLDGELVCAMPLVRIRRMGVSVLASMPYGTFGGPLLGRSAPAGSARALVAAFARLAAAPLIGAAHLTDFAGRIQEAPRGLRATREAAQIVRLSSRTAEEISAGFKPSARNKIRKAEAAGVTVRRAASESDFLEYGDMLAECCRRWRARCGFGPPFFRAMARLDPEAVQMWLAEHEGRIIAGDLNFAMHDMVVNWGNVSRDSARALAPNNLLHAAAIEDARRRGMAIMNLGASAGIEGVDAFKASFGAEPAPFMQFTAEKPWHRALRRAAGRTRREDA